MFGITDLTNLTNINLSILLVVFGVLLLYFGKIISTTKVEHYDKTGYYMEGLFFFLGYVLLPGIVSYFVKDFIALPFSAAFLIQIVIFGLVCWNNIMQEYFRKHGLVGEFEKRLGNKLSGIKQESGFIGKLMKKHERSFKEKFGIDYTRFNVILWYKLPIKVIGNKYILFAFSFMAILSTFSLLKTGNLISSVFSLVLTFLLLSSVALARGFMEAYYPPAKIILDDNKKLKCKILKFGDFVYCLKGDKKFFVNKDKIKYVEENLFKDKEVV